MNAAEEASKLSCGWSADRLNGLYLPAAVPALQAWYVRALRAPRSTRTEREMLRLFRQGGVMKAFMGIVVVLIIAAFAFTSVGTGGGLTATNQCVVEVEGSCVPPKDYNMLLRLVAPAGATDKELRKLGFTDFAINALIERELLLREARRLGVSVSEEQLDDELAMGRVHYSWPVEAPVPSAVARGYPFPTTGATPTVTYIRVRNSKSDAFDYDIYRRQVQNLLRMSPREFKERQENELVAARVRELVTSAVRVAEDEAFADFERKRSQATARTVNVRRSWFERFVVSASDEAVDAYVKANAAAMDEAWAQKKEGFKADCPIISEILLPFSPGADADERAAKGESAKSYRQLLGKGAPFEELARAFGTASSASAGGFVGCLDVEEYGGGGEELVKAVEGMGAGSVSEPIETPRGFHIVKYHGKLAATDAEALARRVIARSAVVEAAATDAAKAFAQKVIDKAKSGGELSAVVDELVLDALGDVSPSKAAADLIVETAKVAADAPEFEVSRPFNRGASPLPGLKERDVATRVFALPEPDALIEEPLETYGGYAVIQLKEKDLATKEAFAEDKNDLIQALKEQKRSDALTNYLGRLRQRAQSIVVNPAYQGKAAAEQATDSETESSG